MERAASSELSIANGSYRNHVAYVFIYIDYQWLRLQDSTSELQRGLKI